MEDGRWYVEVRQIRQEARAYPDRAAAWTVVRAWMRHIGGEWERIPCYGGVPHNWQGERISG